MAEEKITAYCMKCKEKREVQEPKAVFTKTGRAATRGICPECGTTMFRMGETPAHEGLPRPEVTAAPRKKKQKRRGKRKKTTKLVIVESPAKARTVGKFLGKGYKVKASVGHVRDLLRSKLSVDTENNFEPKYRVPKEKREVVNELRDLVKRSVEVYLATDPDREGEAIAWHLLEAARIPPEISHRVVFHEITKQAIEEAFGHPSEIDMDRVNAQQARRILDRLVGYKISPILWRKVRNRLSAGRVQSVALRMICEREREIEAFVPEEYWSIEADLAKREEKPKKRRKQFRAKLIKIRGKKFELTNKEDTMGIVSVLEKSPYIVTDVRKRERRRNPTAPFITSTMQQEASRRLGFTAKRTMAVAQQLYEGITVADESVGLITYMRTDSVNIAEVAQEAARQLIKEKYGEEFLPAKPRKYKTRTKKAQEAHEAIRPTDVRREPAQIKSYLSRNQYRLYDLIWKRFVASQMAPALMDTTSIDINAGEMGEDAPQLPVGELLPAERTKELKKELPYMFRATGSVIKFMGFLIVYEESKDEDEKSDDGEVTLPPIEPGEILDLLKLLPEQHFTQPPPRYNEAKLIRALEEYGIGRPSTYAPIISTIQSRGYVERQQDRRLHPTELGFIVNDLVVEYFPRIVDYGFTAQMEENLDMIATGDREWVPVLREFYEPFEKTVQHAEEAMPEVDLQPEETGELCEKCGKPMIIKWGRYGKFIACSGFPDCRNTKSFRVKIGVTCPECGGELVEKKTKRGRIFYSCDNYPECEFSSWKRPIPTPCPKCAGLLVKHKKDMIKCLKCEEEFDVEEIEKLAEVITAKELTAQNTAQAVSA